MSKAEEKRPIGVFDSGVGGLSVLRQLMEDHPHESFIYLGDTARLPYGTKSPETIIKYAQMNLNFLLKHFNIKALVVACNSVSTVIDIVDSPVPILGVIKPSAKAAIDASKEHEKIGVWATQATVMSGAYQKEILTLRANTNVEVVGCPTLVSLVEEDLDQHPLLPDAFDYYFEKFKDKIDVLILGCTHFPFFKNLLAKKFSDIKLIDSSISLSKNLDKKINLSPSLSSKPLSSKPLSSKPLSSESLDSKPLSSKPLSSEDRVKFFLSDEAENFKTFVKKIFKGSIEIKKIDIDG